MISQALNNRYHIKEELGRGGMGVVYKAHDARLKRDVAVKVVSIGGLGDEGRARLMNEAQAAARLNHPNIVAIYDADEAQLDSGEIMPFVVMELLDGTTLHQLRPENLDQILDLTKQLCRALDHAHQNEIIHRDLKPENVMLVDDGKTVKLMDFGLARSVATRLTAEGVVMGTLFYLSPEMVMGQTVDGRADLYALGVMLYELASGRLPFDAKDPVAVLTQHLHAPVVPPTAHNPELSARLEDLILRLMAKDPAKRPATAGQVLEELELMRAPGIIPEPARELSMLDRIVRGRLVGREAELTQARTMWQEARSGQGRLVLVSGEPGIGKSRLARELATLASASGGQVLEGASYAEGDAPYAPFKEILRRALTNDHHSDLNLPASALANLLALAPELEGAFPGSPPVAIELVSLDQEKLRDDLLLLLSRLSRIKPLLLLLEDVHWADSGTLALLGYLARNTRQLPVMILVTYREVEIDQARAFHQLLLNFSREQLGHRIKLGRLDRLSTEALLAVLFDEEITPEFLDGIYRETEGNPFFIEEVCKALVESGQLKYDDGRWHRPSMAVLGVPQSIQVAVQTRVRALPKRAQEVLEQAAILGRDFEFNTLVKAIGDGEEEVIDALEEALAAQLVEEAPNQEAETYSFVHALIPTTIVAGLRTLRRRRLHRRAATTLETINPKGYEALAYHFVEGADTEKGIIYLIMAGDRARILYAHQEAIEAYESALDHVRESDQVEREANLLMKLAGVYHSAFEFDRSHQAYEEGFAAFRRAQALGRVGKHPLAPHALRTYKAHVHTLDPGQGKCNCDLAVAEQLFSGLVDITPELDVVPDVAQRWEISNDGRRYLFYLRDDVVWSDGHPVTAGDFEFGWKRLLDPNTNSSDAFLFFDIKGAEAYYRGLSENARSVGVRALDDNTLEVELAGPTAYFLQVVSYFKPTPRHAAEIHGPAWSDPDRIVTNGPFVLEEWRDGELLTLIRNPHYRGRFPGNIQAVTIRIGLQPDERIDEYSSDRLDLLDAGEFHYNQLRRQYADEMLIWPALGVNFLVFDKRRPPFDDLRVRQAFALSLDRGHLADNVLEGRVMPASGGLIPPGMPGHRPGIALPFDPPRARRLLAEAGYPDGEGLQRVHFLGRGASEQQDMVRQWRQHLGVDVQLQNLLPEKFIERVAADLRQMTSGGWTPFYPDPDDILRLSGFQGSTSWAKWGWQHERYLTVLEEARKLSDQEQRLTLYEEAEQILLQEVPLLPLFYFRRHWLVKPWVRQTPFSSLKTWHWKEMVIVPHE